jgi:hypothetical protein
MYSPNDHNIITLLLEMISILKEILLLCAEALTLQSEPHPERTANTSMNAFLTRPCALRSTPLGCGGLNSSKEYVNLNCTMIMQSIHFWYQTKLFTQVEKETGN